jgi:hypothetical protein
VSAECGRAADQTTHSPEGIIGRERTGTDRHTLVQNLWAKPLTRGLTQFVCLLWPKKEEFGEPATDIAAVLTVIKRRSEQSQEREGANDWRFDLSGAVLRRNDLSRVHFRTG